MYKLFPNILSHTFCLPSVSIPVFSLLEDFLRNEIYWIEPPQPPNRFYKPAWWNNPRLTGSWNDPYATPRPREVRRQVRKCTVLLGLRGNLVEEYWLIPPDCAGKQTAIKLQKESLFYLIHLLIYLSFFSWVGEATQTNLLILGLKKISTLVACLGFLSSC